MRIVITLIALLTLQMPVYGREASGRFIDMGEFKCTAYCPCCDCSEGYDDSTATQKTAKPRHTIAVDPDVIPFGTRILIGDTVYTAEDCGAGITGDEIDIYMDDHEATEKFGVKHLHVYIVKEVEF